MTDAAAPPGAPPPALRREIATARRDILMPVFGNLMRPTDDVLVTQGGGRGLKIYEEIERDPLAFAVLQKRKLALIQRDWEVRPGGPRREDRKAADLADRVLNGEWGLSFDRVCLDLLDATLKGYAVAEIVWDVADGFIVPVAIRPKNQRRFTFDVDGRPRLLTFESMVEGEELPERKFLVHRFGDSFGDPFGRGLGHQLFWWVYFKRMVMQFWLVFAEKFGSPTVKGEYDTTMTEEDQAKLLDTLTSLAQQGALIFPQGTVVELMEAVRSGTVTYPDLVEYCDTMITLATLGNKLTTTEGKAGSRALGQVHQAVEDTIVDADADLLSGTLNPQLLAWITWFNFPGARPPTVWRPRPTEEEAEAKLLQEQLKALDMALAHADARRRSGWMPVDSSLSLVDMVKGDWTYVPPVDPVPRDDSSPPALAAPAPRPRDAADDLADQLAEIAAPALDGMIERVRAIIAAAPDLPAAIEAMLAEYDTIDDGELARVLAAAMETAALSGAAEVAHAPQS
jgi:phage gp29-like protein